MSGRARRLTTYTAGSVIAAGCSEVALVVCYGLLDLAPGVSSTIAWVAGAVPNYWLNRSWTWQRRGRPSFVREVLPYVAIILVTLVLAALVTKGVDSWLRDAEVSGTTRTVAVAVAFLGVYVIMFVVRYVLLDRLFRPRGGAMSDAFTQATGRGLEDDAGTDQRRYKAFQLELMRPYFGTSLLEVGAGLGEFAAQVTGLERHVVTDVDAGAVAAMATRFADRPAVEARVLDLDGCGEPGGAGRRAGGHGARHQRAGAHRGRRRGAAPDGRPDAAGWPGGHLGAGLPAAVRRVRPRRGSRTALHARHPARRVRAGRPPAAGGQAGEPARRRRLVADGAPRRRRQAEAAAGADLRPVRGADDAVRGAPGHPAVRPVGAGRRVRAAA